MSTRSMVMPIYEAEGLAITWIKKPYSWSQQPSTLSLRRLSISASSEVRSMSWCGKKTSVSMLRLMQNIVRLVYYRLPLQGQIQRNAFIPTQLSSRLSNDMCYRSPILIVLLSSSVHWLLLSLMLGGLFLVGLFLLLLELLLLGSDGLEVTSNEEINQLLPLLSGLEGSSQDLDLTGEEPENGGDGLGHSVVAGDDNIDVLKGSIGIAESNGGDVDIGSLNDGLPVVLGVSNHQQSGLLELLGHLIGQGSGDPSGGSGGSASSVLSELVDGSLSVLLGADNDDLREAGDGSNDSCGELNSSVDLIHLEDVVSVGVLSLNEGLHVVVDLLSAEVHVGGQEAEDVSLLSVGAHLPQIILIFNIQLMTTDWVYEGWGLAKKGRMEERRRGQGWSNDYLDTKGSALIVFSAVQDGLSHAICVLWAGPFPLPHVYIGSNFLPTCLNIQFCVLFFQFSLFSQIIPGPLTLFFLFSRHELLQLLPSLFLSLLFILPFSLLTQGMKIHFSLSEYPECAPLLPLSAWLFRPLRSR